MHQFPVGPRRRLAARALLACAVAGSLTAGSATWTATGAEAAIDTNSKVSVAKAYAKLRKAEATPVSWTGSTTPCRPGTVSAATQSATLAAINFYRELGHLRTVRFSSTLNGKAQKAALLMDANTDLSHAPPRGWRCWTSAGSEAAGRSNLALGVTGPLAISAYMADYGSGNTSAGHRRWIMYPPTTTMGSGSTRRANALWVVGAGSRNPTGTPAWTSWPTTGYMPASLEPEGRWSLSSTDPSISFGSATVHVRDFAGASLKVQKYAVHDAYANHTLVWKVSGLKLPSGGARKSYRVTVTGIKKSGSAKLRTHLYTVRFFNPEYVSGLGLTPRMR
jgi:uncharacterized protein YkwD